MSDQNAGDDLTADDEQKVDVMASDDQAATRSADESSTDASSAEESSAEESSAEESSAEESSAEESSAELDGAGLAGAVGDAEVTDADATDPDATDPEATDPEATDPEAGESAAAEGAEGSAAAAVEVESASSEEDEEDEDQARMQWYILKVQVNREDSIRDALVRRVKIAGLEEFFGDVVVPIEEVAEFNRSGKRRVVKRKLYPGYIMANMIINDDTWFLVRETPGIGDFTGSAGKPTPMEASEVERIIFPQKEVDPGEGGEKIKINVPFSEGNRVRVKDGYFQNFEGDVESIDEATGRVTVIVNIFGRSTPVELQHYQIEKV